MGIRRTLASLLAVPALAAALWFGAGPGHADEQSTLARIISWALSTPENRVTVGAVEGALSSDAVIRNLRIADRDGVWLTLDRAKFSWRRLALLSQRLEIDALEVDRLTLARRPERSETDREQAAGAPVLPDLPVKLIVRDLAVRELVLGEPVLGAAARIAIAGRAELGDPTEGLTLALTIDRRDAPGRIGVALSYTPKTTQLNVDITADEPANGLLARLANVPGLPPVQLALKGAGPLDAFAATLAYGSGADIGAQGRITLGREPSGRKLGVDLTARVEGLLPAAVAPVFAGTTTVQGDVLLGDDGGVALRQVALASRTATLTVGGTVDAQRRLDLTLAGRSVPAADGITRGARGGQIGRLALDATLKGTAQAPVLAGTLAAADIAGPAGGVKRIDATLKAERMPGGGPERASIALDLAVDGLAPADEALARAVGPRIVATARGTLAGLVADLTTARIETATALASYEGRIGPRTIDGKASLRVADLSPFSGLAERPLGGALQADVRLTGDPGRYRIDAVVDAKATDARADIAALDRLLSGTVTLQGTVRRLPGGVGFEALRVDGRHLGARLDGRATSDAADATGTVVLPDLGRVDPRLTGRADGRVRLTGSLAKPDLEAAATVTGATSLGRPIPRLIVTATARDVTGALDAQLRAEGEVDRKPLAVQARVTALQGGYTVRGLDASVGSVRANGDLTLNPQGLADGRIAVAARDLSDLAPLLLTPLGGDLAATVTLASAGGAQAASVEARGGRLSFGDASLRRLDATAQGRDLRRAPIVDATVAVDELVAGGQRFETIRLTSRGDPAGSAFEARAKGLGLDFESRGRLVPGPPVRIDLDALSAQRGRERLALAQPARFTLVDGGVTIAGLAIAAGGGRITADGTVGGRLSLVADIRAVPLAVAAIAVPTLRLEGVADGRVELTGSRTAPAGSFRLALARVATAERKAGGVPPADLRAAGTLRDGRASIEATLAAGRGYSLQVSGSIPLDRAGRLDLRARGSVDAALANARIVGSGQRVAGRISLDATATGSLGQPVLGGTATLASGSFEDVVAGTRLTPITAKITARGDTLTIDSLTAGTPQGGSLQASGRVKVDPEAGFPAEIRLTGKRAVLVSNPTVEARADLALTITGPLARSPRIGGRVDILGMDVAIPERLGGTLEPLPGTRHIRPGPAASARLRAERAAGGGRAAPPLVAILDVTVAAQNRILVRGRGLDAELGGQLRLQGTSAAPVANGAFTLRRGKFALAGQTLELVRGSLSFDGTLTPELDFLAQTQAAGVTAQIAVTGEASSPAIAISSRPELPQDEVLSRILFGNATGELTGFQALQIAQTIAQLSGSTGGFDGLRKALGVDSVDVTASSGGAGVGLTKALGDRIRLGVRAGTSAADTGVGVDVEVTKRIKLKAQVGVDGNASGGVAAEWDY